VRVLGKGAVHHRDTEKTGYSFPVAGVCVRRLPLPRHYGLFIIDTAERE
jgi:hypothetical protein